MATATTSTIVALFQSRSAAEKAVAAMVDGGFLRDEMSVVASNAETAAAEMPNITTLEGSTDAGTGAAVGGLAGFIGGIVALAIPGLGPILAVGPLAAGLMGAGIGVAAGGLVGALKGHGVPEADAARLSEAIRRGRVLVMARVPEQSADRAADILEDNGAIDVEETDAPVTSSSSPTPMRVTPEGVRAARTAESESLADRARRRRVTVYPGITGMGPTPNS